MDVIALFQNEITYAVATLGTCKPQTIYNAYFDIRQKLSLFDGDQAGRSGMACSTGDVPV